MFAGSESNEWTNTRIKGIGARNTLKKIKVKYISNFSYNFITIIL